MKIQPIPFFEARSRFANLNMDTLENEHPEVSAFLLTHDTATGAIESYMAVRFFLSMFSDNACFDSYRSQIEKLLSWSICVVAKPLMQLDADDMVDFMEFCDEPPSGWVSTHAHQRFIRSTGRKRGSITTYVINPDWRPFVSGYEKDRSELGGHAPLPELRARNKASVAQLTSICRSFFLFLAAEDLVSISPMREIDRSGSYAHSAPTYEQPSVFSPVEWSYIVLTIENMIRQDSSHERTLFIVMSAYHLYLKPGDFDKYSRTVKMDDFYRDDHGCAWLNLGASHRGIERVRVPEDYLVVHLQRYRCYLGTHLDPLDSDSTALFSAGFGRPGLSRGHVNRLFHDVLAQAAMAMEHDGYSGEDTQNLRVGSLKWVRHTSASVSAQRLAASELHADLRNVNPDVTDGRYYGFRNQMAARYSGYRNYCTSPVYTSSLDSTNTEVLPLSRLAEFRHLEQQLAAQLAGLEVLKNDDGLKKDMEFEKKLRNLLAEHNFSLRDVISIVDPQAVHRKTLQVPAVEKTSR